MARLARAFGVLAALLAWTAAAVGYTRTGAIRWDMVAAGAFFGIMPFMATRESGPPRAR